mmetsp:Transcript_20314/g.28551  ORF Transcript_20314/g.28551 Transcript_20314/m.28551 type:complete len:275 (+) Transcript_20314:504-1328(+)
MHSTLFLLVQKGLISDYHIYIIEQSDDQRKFNRGKLLNIGFDLARQNQFKGKFRSRDESLLKTLPSHDILIFHDVDLFSDNVLAKSYGCVPSTPLHIARVWDRYSNNAKYFGGIVSFSAKDMVRINGHPNNFWGWGGEDDEMQKRCEALGIKWDSPVEGSITDMEEMSLKEKLNFLRSNKEWKCMTKWEALDEHATTWKQNGLADLHYKVQQVMDLDELRVKQLKEKKEQQSNSPITTIRSHATKITVNVMLNGKHWTNKKCAVDYMPPPNQSR